MLAADESGEDPASFSLAHDKLEQLSEDADDGVAYVDRYQAKFEKLLEALVVNIDELGDGGSQSKWRELAVAEWESRQAQAVPDQADVTTTQGTPKKQKSSVKKDPPMPKIAQHSQKVQDAADDAGIRRIPPMNYARASSAMQIFCRKIVVGKLGSDVVLASTPEAIETFALTFIDCRQRQSAIAKGMKIDPTSEESKQWLAAVTEWVAIIQQRRYWKADDSGTGPRVALGDGSIPVTEVHSAFRSTDGPE
jgi:hypothetical protein